MSSLTDVAAVYVITKTSHVNCFAGNVSKTAIAHVARFLGSFRNDKDEGCMYA